MVHDIFVDNWKSVREHLKFENEDQFYFIELMQRKKDNPNFSANNRMVKYYFVHSLEYYDSIEDEVKKLADVTGARVYILVNRRSYKQCCLNVLADAAKMAIDSNYLHFPKLISSVVGKFSNESEKNWIVDLDGIDSNEESEICTFIDHLEPFSDTSKVKWINPTLNGKHLITAPFNAQKFKIQYPSIDIHKDNPTLLYFRKC